MQAIDAVPKAICIIPKYLTSFSFFHSVHEQHEPPARPFFLILCSFYPPLRRGLCASGHWYMECAQRIPIVFFSCTDSEPRSRTISASICDMDPEKPRPPPIMLLHTRTVHHHCSSPRPPDVNCPPRVLSLHSRITTFSNSPNPYL